MLYKNKIPRYVIGLNEDCILDEKTSIIKEGGSITLLEVSMDKTTPEKLECFSQKGDNLDDYKIVNVEANDYIIKNGILYISYDGKNIIELPGDYSDIDEFEENTYQISREKTIFSYKKNGKQMLIFSDNGTGWETAELPAGYSIQNLQFLNKELGFILEFEDVAMGEAFGRILKTTDGGRTWQDINNGIGAEGEKRFKRNSRIKFVNEEIGFLTMPSAGGDKADLYITKDGGTTFNRLEIMQTEEEKQIYDYYNLPERENETLILKIGQGSDGDYNGGDSKTYTSKDNGITWISLK